MENKKEQAPSFKLSLSKDEMQKLYKGGMIKKETFDRACKYASGGEVQDPALQGKIDSAIQNTLEQAQAGDVAKLPEKNVFTAPPASQRIVDGMTAGYQNQSPEIQGEELMQTQRVPQQNSNAEKMVTLDATPAAQQPQTATDAGFSSPVAQEYNKAFDLMGMAALQEAQAGVAQGARVSGFMNKVADDLKVRQQQDEATEEVRRAKLDEQMSKVNLAVDEFKQASAIDPNRFWANKSTGQRVAAGIAIFLGGLGRGNVENDALKTINTLVDRDIESQKAQATSALSGATEQSNIFKLMLDQTGDQRAAEKASKLAYIDIVEMQMKGLAAQSSSQSVQAQYLKGISQIQMEKAKVSAELQKRLSILPAIKGAGEFERQYINLPEDYQKRAVKLPDGTLGIALNDQAAKDTSKLLVANQDIENKIGQLMAVSNWKVLPTEEKGRIKSLAAQLKLDIKNAENLGALDKGSIEVADDIIGDPTSFFSSNTKGKLQSYRNTVRQKNKNILQQNILGYQAIDERAN